MPRSKATSGSDAAARPWVLLAHPLFLDQVERLVAAAEAEQSRRADAPGAATKLLGHLLDLMTVKIPAAPGDPSFRHGGAIPGGHRDWSRAKTGNGRFRLFFRYSTAKRVIVFGWLNDEESLRRRGARDDVYQVFGRMLASGNPPSDIDALIAAAGSPKERARLRRLLGR